MGIKSEAGLRVGRFRIKIILHDAHFMHICIKSIVTEKRLSDSNTKRSLLSIDQRKENISYSPLSFVSIVWLQVLAVNILGRFLLNNDKNIRYEFSLPFFFISLTFQNKQALYYVYVLSTFMDVLLCNPHDFTLYINIVQTYHSLIRNV